MMTANSVSGALPPHPACGHLLPPPGEKAGMRGHSQSVQGGLAGGSPEFILLFCELSRGD